MIQQSCSLCLSQGCRANGQKKQRWVVFLRPLGSSVFFEIERDWIDNNGKSWFSLLSKVFFCSCLFGPWTRRCCFEHDDRTQLIQLILSRFIHQLHLFSQCFADLFPSKLWIIAYQNWPTHEWMIHPLNQHRPWNNLKIVHFVFQLPGNG